MKDLDITHEEGFPAERMGTQDIRILPSIDYKSSYNALAGDVPSY